MSDLFEDYKESEEWDVVEDLPLYRPVRSAIHLLEQVAEESHIQYQALQGWRTTSYVDVAFKSLPEGDD